MEYRYGMRMRGFSLGCQPKQGFIERQDDTTGKYYDIIVYDRELTEEEIDQYDLDLIKEDKGMKKDTEGLKFKDMIFEQEEVNGNLVWAARIHVIDRFVIAAYEHTKKDCMKAARQWIHRVNEDFDRFLEGLRELDEQELTEQTTVQPEEDVVDAFLLGYLPKKKQMAVVRLTKDDDGYHAAVASGEMVDRRTWKEFMKAFREVTV